MADTDLEKWKLVIQAVAALGGLSAMATLILALNQRRRPKLKLWLNSSRGESFGFGDYDKGEPTYFYHIIAKNMRIRVAENVGLLLTRVSKATAEGAFPDGKLPSPVRLRAAPGKFESKKRCSDQRLTARCVAGNFHIFVVLYCGEPHDADAQTALSR